MTTSLKRVIAVEVKPGSYGFNSGYSIVLRMKPGANSKQEYQSYNAVNVSYLQLETVMKLAALIADELGVDLVETEQLKAS